MKKEVEEKIKKVRRAVTQEDLDSIPELAEQGIEVGTIMRLPEVIELENEEELENDDLEDSEDEDLEDESDESEDDIEENEPLEKGKKNGSVTFKIKNDNDPSNVSTRVFSHKEHGNKYLDLASSFEESNTHKKITNDMSDDEKADASLFNKTVKHHIISKKVSE